VIVFGDDGFRSKFGERYMTLEFLSAFTCSVSEHCRRGRRGLPVLVGRDTRESGRTIENLIVSILNYTGVDVQAVGVIPTPGLASLLRRGRFAIGIMITASHDPADNNGIKLFESSGFKLDERTERVIEAGISQVLAFPFGKYGGSVGSYSIDRRQLDQYVEQIRPAIPREISSQVLIDCSNGAYSEIAQDLVKDLETIECDFNRPNGSNINRQCGALESQMLLERVRSRKFDYGVAFDGDGDRAIFVSRTYGVIETEKLIIMFAKSLVSEDRPKTIVTTEICNKGLEKNCEGLGFDLIQVKVGDRNVVNRTVCDSGLLGAEPTGHYFFPGESTTMDGFLAFAYFLRLLNSHRVSLVEELRALSHFNRVRVDLPADENSTDIVERLYQRTDPFLNRRNEKLVIRRSMWEPVLRIYYDYENENRFDELNNLLRSIAKKSQSGRPSGRIRKLNQDILD